MKIGILALSSKEDGGVYQYTLSLIEAVKNYLHNEKYRYIQITNEQFPKILSNCITIKTKKSDPLLKLKRAFHIIFGIKLGDLLGSYNHPKIKELDLIISPIISFLPYHMQKPYIVTIHDFQHKYYPDFFTLRERISRKIVYKTAKKANIVVCESNYVKSDIMKFLKVDEAKIKVIPSPPPSYITQTKIEEEQLLDVKRKYNLPKKFLFYPAQFWFHKNHIKLLQALALIRGNYNEKIDIVLVGSKKSNFENTILEIKKLNLENSVKYLGYVPQNEMPYLYKLATALVMPTFFESVSIPIWEAFYLGIPVVSSNVCALPEQVGDAGLLFDPIDVENMAEKIYRIWTDESLRRELVQKGYERVKNMTLENYAKQWEKIIEEIL